MTTSSARAADAGGTELPVAQRAVSVPLTCSVPLRRDGQQLGSAATAGVKFSTESLIRMTGYSGI